VDQRLERALENAEQFFMKTGKVHRAAVEIARRLDAAAIPYAIGGALALGAHGYERLTVDVDVFAHPRRARRAQARMSRTDLSTKLNPYVRDKYRELWRAAQAADLEQE
jgi:hypothetical protein